eukprot:c12420_g1_i1.p1 GENE.c12420_g1_i1~~c12420_g1_i1.p1  ORF type:complete len:132 (+),score=25.28 c12420_g1_i1:53-397(+)
MVYITPDGGLSETRPGGTVAKASAWGVANVFSLFFQTLFSPLSTEELIAEQRGQRSVSTLGNTAASRPAASASSGSGTRLGSAGGSGGGSRTGSNVATIKQYGSCGSGGQAAGG